MAGFLTLPATRAGTPASGLALPPLPARVFSACFVFAAAGLYFIGFWTGGRRTLPMKTWRIALVRCDGRAVDARTAVVRYLGAWIGPVASLAAYSVLHPLGFGAQAAWLLPIGYVWPLVDPDRQFLHDRIAGTRIVMAKARLSSGAPARHPR